MMTSFLYCLEFYYSFLCNLYFFCFLLFLYFFISLVFVFLFFFFSSRRRHTRWNCDWSSDVCSSDLRAARALGPGSGGTDAASGGSWPRALVADSAAFVAASVACFRHRGQGGRFRGMEIGRASCRERVEISVVGVAVKEKIGW